MTIDLQQPDAVPFTSSTFVVPDPSNLASQAQNSQLQSAQEGAEYPVNAHGVRGDGTIHERPINDRRKMRVICVGAGISGLYMAIKLPRSTENVELKIYEKNHDLGGTWLENRYPGCACDVPAHAYAYSFENNPEFPRFFSSSEDIHKYLLRVADKYDCKKYIAFNTKVVEAIWDEEQGIYNVKIERSDGTVFQDTCEVLLNASGILNAWRYPGIPGIKDYKGTLMHSATWDRSVSLKGKKVALIGSGSSGIQILPNILDDCKEVVTYIIDPAWIAPANLVTAGVSDDGEEPKEPTPEELASSSDFAYSQEQINGFKKDPKSLMDHRATLERTMNQSFPILLRGSPSNLYAASLFEDLMRKRLAKKPEVADAIIPEWSIGCRRLTPGPHYLEALCNPKVKILTQAIKSFSDKGMYTADGEHEDFDVVICATGFDVSFRPRFKFIGKDGYEVPENFGQTPKGYLALAYAGFPNSFIFMGPNGPIANGSVVVSLEKQGDYFIKAINKIQRQNIKGMTVRFDAVDDFTNHVDKYMDRTVLTDDCISWYKNGKRDGRVSAVWPGSALHYMEAIADPRWEDYTYTYREPGHSFSFLGDGTSWVEHTGGDTAWYLKETL